MVFPGRFSSGCIRCRQRKVKCDEAKPACRRCYTYGAPCPGYTDQFHFRWHAAESPSAAVPGPGPKKRRAVPRIHRSSYNQEGPAASFTTTLSKEVVNTGSDYSSGVVWKLSPSAPLPLSYEQVSICYFVRRFASPHYTDKFPGHLTFLPHLLNNDVTGLVKHATLSVALLATQNCFGGDSLQRQSYLSYGRALGLLRQAISSEERVTEDNVIAAVLLLCIFLDISGENLGDPSNHVVGLYYLLEKRGMKQLTTRNGLELFILALLRLVSSSSDGASPPAKPKLQHAYSFIHNDDTYNNPGGFVTAGLVDPLIHGMALASKVLRLRHSLLGLLENQQTSPYTSHKDSPDSGCAPIDECFIALNQFDILDAEAVRYWLRTFNGRKFPSILGEATTKATHYDPETACTIVLIRTSRLIMLLSILEYHDKLQSPYQGFDNAAEIMAGWTDCVASLKHLIHWSIDDMLSCAPYALGFKDANSDRGSMTYDGAVALLILQPMRLVTYCQFATTQQVEIGKEILHRINSNIGIKSARAWDGEEETAVNRVCTVAKEY